MPLDESKTDGWNYYAVAYGNRHRLMARTEAEAIAEAKENKAATAVVKVEKTTVWKRNG